MLHDMLKGLVAIGHPHALLFLAVGTLLGVAVGATPGLGGIVLLASLLPFLYNMPVVPALVLMLSAHAAIYFSGSITSILLNTPGTPEAAATTFDGYEMTKQGKARRALGISACSTVLGGWIGMLILLPTIPILGHVATFFQPSDFLTLAILAIALIGQLRAASLTKGMLSGLFGLMMAYVGYDPITGVQRFSFHILALYDGFDIAVVALGLFAIAEMFHLYGINRAIASDTRALLGAGEPGARIRDGVRDVFGHWWLLVRSSLIGTLLGIVPGVGGVAATFICYGQAQRTSKNPELFGHGSPEGVIAPESAAIAKESGSLVPTVALGVPGSAGMAVLMSAFTILGLAPGPSMIKNHLPEIYMMAFIIGITSIISSAVGLLATPLLARLARIPGVIIVPFIIALGLLGAFAATQETFQVGAVLGIGVVGLLMRRFGYSPASMIIAFILGGIVEKNLYLTVQLQGWPALYRPSTAALILLTVLILIGPSVRRLWKNRSGADREADT